MLKEFAERHAEEHLAIVAIVAALIEASIFCEMPSIYVKVHADHNLWSKLRIGQWQTDDQAKVLYESELIEPNPVPEGHQ